MNPIYFQTFCIVFTIIPGIMVVCFLWQLIIGDLEKRRMFLVSAVIFLSFLYLSILSFKKETSSKKLPQTTRLLGRLQTTINPSDKKYYVRVEKKWLSLDEYGIQVDSVGRPDSVYVYSTIPRKFFGFLNADYDSLPNYFLRKEQDIILEGNYSEAEMK